MFTTHIGQIFSGGVIFHQFINSSNIEEVIIVSINDLSQESIWIDTTGYFIGATSKYNGIINTQIINSDNTHNESAAQLCSNYIDGNWYLPSIFELDLLKHSIWNVNYTLSTIEGSDELSSNSFYWTSTEDSPDYAYYYSFVNGNIGLSSDKKSKFRVRPIKRITIQ